MGRDLRLYPKNASKSELVSFVKSFGNVQPSTHLWDWPKGSVHYHWFDGADYKSTTGVEITIYPTRDNERSFGNNEWAMHVRNTYSATWHDVNMLNTFLRVGRKNFGGNIIGDYGKNRYATLWEDGSTPMSRGLAQIREMSSNNLGSILHALPPELNMPNEGDMEFLNIVKQFDPSRVIYNGLIPFLISVFEFYLKGIFIIGLTYDPDAHEKVEAVGITEDQIADNVSFQDLRNVKKIFTKWLDINIKASLDQSGNEAGSLWKRLGDLIQYRHDIIHRMGVDTGLSRDDFLKEARLIEEVLEVLLRTFAEKYGIVIESDEGALALSD